jgi:hypothetical protein
MKCGLDSSEWGQDLEMEVGFLNILMDPTTP